MTNNIDRSFESALEAVLEAGKQQSSINANRDNLLKKLVSIGYANQFSPEDRIVARRDIKEVISDHLGKSLDKN